MREQIANLQVSESNQPNPKYRLLGYNVSDQILTLLREEGYVQLPENMSGAELIDWYAEHNYGKRQKGS